MIRRTAGIKGDFTAFSGERIALLYNKAREYSREWNPVQIAAFIAGRAHEGQRLKLDKTKPYLTHPAHLASRLQNPLDKQVTFLHDIFERSNLEPEDLIAMGIAPEVIQSVQKMTRTKDVLYLDHIRELSYAPRAVRVKIEDILHNTQADRRLTHTDPKKIAKQAAYMIGLHYLEAVRDKRIEPGTPMEDFVHRSGQFFKKDMPLEHKEKMIKNLQEAFHYHSSERLFFRPNDIHSAARSTMAPSIEYH